MTDLAQPGNSTAEIRRLIRARRVNEACGLTGRLLTEVTGNRISKVTINNDRYSLNSVNGIAVAADGGSYFFKFHQEDGEEDGVEEYYNARALAAAGYPVQEPLFAETTPGKQVLVYDRIYHPRLADVCSAIEKGNSQFTANEVVSAQIAADKEFSLITIETLRHCANSKARKQAIFQLFHNRLTDEHTQGRTTTLGGRVAQFYMDGHADWPGLSIPFKDIWSHGWNINGVSYPASLGGCFETSLKALEPEAFLPGPVVTAHGDAHNANVWYHSGKPGRGAHLSLFDPAFAGSEIPALLAEIKATFHNIFAHPFWLYEPDICTRHFRAIAELDGTTVVVETNYDLSPLRKAFLLSKADHFWVPLLLAMKRKNWLPEDWEHLLRLALFCCPTLVMNLSAGPGSSHNPVSSLIGFAQAIRAASAPSDGSSDMFASFFARIKDGLSHSANHERGEP